MKEILNRFIAPLCLIFTTLSWGVDRYYSNGEQVVLDLKTYCQVFVLLMSLALMFFPAKRRPLR